MPVLSDADLVDAMARGRLTIENFDERNLTPNGYDVTVAEVFVPTTEVKTTRGSATIWPSSRFAVSTLEVFHLGPDLCAEIWLRTTWARRGVLGSFGKIDAGFRGTLTLAAFNASNEALEIPMGDRFAQVVFETLTSPAKAGYAERSGHYQDQSGVRLK